MFDIGWPEMLVIAIVLIVVVGPKDLPRMLRSFGRTTSKLRAMAGDFRKQFDEALKEAELDDVKSLVDDARKLDPRNEIKKHLNPIEKVGQEIRAGLDAAMKPDAAKGGEPATSETHAAAPVKGGATQMPGETPAEAAKPAAKAKAPAKRKAPPAKSSSVKTPAAKGGAARPAGKKSSGAAS
ncbi:Sec-independent protein translocase protein TatB [Nitratireductor sp. ZSWI3]|uniref:Sec-independent protein translocase protein TatB n=1 Tax=Nitratireductor sp. ZSWI3 TaxID=2966359 RepID=UPI00214F6E72|nr:Sec-independent protein translocase protein TatB [Nitratireductor sp. ZSWI3]MCR4267526.1 Sec-independent protein translocase protein TatB [Nitratireductor sp. ZSWI3]